MVDTPYKPSTAMKLKSDVKKIDHSGLGITYIINTEPHSDHWAGNSYFNVPVIAHEGVRDRIVYADIADIARQIGRSDQSESAELLLGDYHMNSPLYTFGDHSLMNIGDHTFEMIHMPGHTPYQSAIVVKEEGVVFTSDNVFHKVQSWLHECNPDEWLNALESLRHLDEDILVPGHGLICGKDYLDEQGEFIVDWKNHVWDAISRGMDRHEIVALPNGLMERYPMDIETDTLAPTVARLNAVNLYKYLTGDWIPIKSKSAPLKVSTGR